MSGFKDMMKPLMSGIDTAESYEHALIITFDVSNDDVRNAINSHLVDEMHFSKKEKDNNIPANTFIKEGCSDIMGLERQIRRDLQGIMKEFKYKWDDNTRFLFSYQNANASKG